jgi:hypothetical protein
MSRREVGNCSGFLNRVRRFNSCRGHLFEIGISRAQVRFLPRASPRSRDQNARRSSRPASRSASRAMGTPRAAPHGRRSTQSTRTTSLNVSGVQRPIVALRTARKGPATFETRRSRRRRVRPRPPLPRSRMVANCSEEEAMAHTKLVIGTAPVRTALADGRRARGGGDLREVCSRTR